MKSQQSTNAFVKETFMDLKTQLETIAKNHQASIQNLETKFDRLADKQSGRPSGSLPSNTQPNPKAHNSKAYQPPQSRNEHVNAIFTRSGKSYNPPINPNDQQNDFETPINFDSYDEDDEPTPQTKTQNPKSVKETLLPKPYKPKIPYPQRLRKEKMEAQYRKFLDMIRAVRINVPLIDILVGMPNYGKFLKELISNKHKIEQISATFLSDESSAMIQNKVPPKLGDPGSFLFHTLKPTKMSVRLADRSFQYLIGIAKNMLVEVGKFTFPADFVILEIEEDSKVLLILGRPFLHTADAVIRVKQKQLNLRVGTERMIFNIDSAMKHSYSNDDTCFSIDEILEEDFNALLDEGSKILYSIERTLLEKEIFAEFDEFMAMTANENSNSESGTEDPPFQKITINTDYKIKTSLEEPPTDLELKPLPDNLEYVFLKEPSFLPVIISSQLSKEKKNKLIFVLKKHKQAFAWKTTDIPGICPSFCKHKIQLLDDKKPVVQKQRRLNQNMQEVVKKNHETPGYRRMPFRLCNAPATFQRCMLAIFHDMIEKSIEEKCYFMVKEGIVLGHKVSSTGLEVEKGKINVISKLPPPTNIKGIRSFLGHAGFYRRFIKDFSKIARPLTKLLEKDTPFEFDDECQKAFESSKEKPTCAPVIPITYPESNMMKQAMTVKSMITFPEKLSWKSTPMPKALINDRGTHFCNKIMEKTMKRYEVNHRFSTSHHPETSGQVENTNRALKRILEKTVKDNTAIWSRKLDDALWAFRTAYKTPTSTTPYKPIYGKNYHLPLEIEHRAYWSLKNCNPDLIAAGKKIMF
ncbi:reverse transcriptase domain-containing protein [Tanacetum coccineum]|uniref:Reverse transcriptase domain-containing protein n=1 Tax=Tanacetum coccineum TaxID=301880 RepID=A0ABQ5H0I0_9ASTR